jgi:hypothetical protein
MSGIVSWLSGLFSPSKKRKQPEADDEDEECVHFRWAKQDPLLFLKHFNTTLLKHASKILSCHRSPVLLSPIGGPRASKRAKMAESFETHPEKLELGADPDPGTHFGLANIFCSFFPSDLFSQSFHHARFLASKSCHQM